MKKKISTAAIVAFASMALSALTPEVGMVEMSQPSNDRTVTITYSLVDSSAAVTLDPAVITLDIQTNDTGDVWASIGGENIQRVSGDVNKRVSGKESYTIKWLAGRDFPGRVFESGKVRAVITAWATDYTPDYMVVDLTAEDGDNVRYYTSTNFLPGGLLGNPVYRTTSMVMRRIDAKNIAWVMGNSDLENGYADETPHEVMLTNDYYIGVFEVTQKQWESITGGKPTEDYVGDMRPVQKVSYNRVRISGDNTADAEDWAKYDWPNLPYENSFLGALRARTGVDFDLPSEAEWEFACRAGSRVGCVIWKDGAFEDGSKWNNENMARFGTIAIGSTIPPITKAGSLAPNPWGLYDMYGNVIEWCLDWYTEDITTLGGKVNTTIVDSGKHARRGGAYNNGLKLQRASCRGSNAPNATYNSVGLRLTCRAGLR